MGNLSSAPKISSKDKAVLELKVQRDKLKQYEKKLCVVIERELAIAKTQLTLKNHHAARLALSKKKYQEGLLAKTGEQLLNIEQLTATIEYSMVEQEIIKKLALGNDVLKLIHKEMVRVLVLIKDLEKVEKIMDDTADGIAYQNEIQEIISKEFSPEDEQDIMDELDKLIEMEVQENVQVLPNVPDTAKKITNLPDVPTTDPTAITNGSTSDTVKNSNPKQRKLAAA